MNTHTAQVATTNQVKVPGSISGYKKLGVPASFVRSLAINNWHYPPQFLDTLDSYYLLFWDAQYFFQNLQEGTITRQGVRYQVVYYFCTPTELRKAGAKGEQIALSFRKTNASYAMENYVLVAVNY